MAWPCRPDLWHDEQATAQNYADVAHAIRRFEPVTMVVAPEHLASARDLLGSDIELLEMPIDDSWMRDIGPSFVVNEANELAGVCFRFNAWGEKYAHYEDDALLGRRLLDRLHVPAITSELVAEGGGLSVDGDGTLLTTDSCFPNPNRNPFWGREDIETELQRQLGVERVIWLPGDPLDKETDGHVDGLAVFAAPGRVVVETAGSADREPFFDALCEALENATDARGRRFELIEIPEASASVATGGRFCLSYVNFYIANGAVIAPGYGLDSDAMARERLQSAFPDREIVTVPILKIAEGGGGIHCITQQQPMVPG
jgi:agmatine deiminase